MRNRLCLGLCALAWALQSSPVLAHGYEPRRVILEFAAKILFSDKAGKVTFVGANDIPIAPPADWTAKRFGDRYLFKHKGFQGYFLQGNAATHEVQEIRNQASFALGNGPVTKTFACWRLGANVGTALLSQHDGKGPQLHFWPANESARLMLGTTRLDTPGDWTFVQKAPHLYDVRWKGWPNYYLEVDTDQRKAVRVQQLQGKTVRNTNHRAKVVVDSHPYPVLKTIDLVPSQPFVLVLSSHTSHVQVSVGGHVMVHDADWQKAVTHIGNIHLRRPDWKGFFWSLNPKAKRLYLVTGAEFGKEGGNLKQVKATVSTTPSTSITIDAQGGAKMTLWGPGNAVRLLAKGLLLAPTNYFEIHKVSPFEFNIRTKNWKFNKFHWAIDASLGTVWKVANGNFGVGAKYHVNQELLPLVAKGKEAPPGPKTTKWKGQSGF